MKVLKSIELMYDRSSSVEILEAGCDFCGGDTLPVLSVDTSGGEYGPINICIKCIHAAFEGEVK